jgi:hypothetical protein
MRHCKLSIGRSNAGNFLPLNAPVDVETIAVFLPLSSQTSVISAKAFGSGGLSNTHSTASLEIQ